MRECLKKFDRIFLINMDSRTDRLEISNEIFTKHNIADLVERFPAVKPENNDGKRGIIESNVSIIKKAKDLKLKSILVFEDDFYFINTEYFNNIITQLFEDEWDLFYLGYNSHEPLFLFKKNLLNIRNCFAAHAIAFHENIYDTILEAYNLNKIKIWDVWLRDNLQNNRYKVYGAFPIGALQRNDYSNIEKKDINYDFILTRYYKNTKHLTSIFYKIKSLVKRIFKI